MDEILRRLERSVQEGSCDLRTLRYHQWRAGMTLSEALPGDLVELKAPGSEWGYSRSRGIFVKKWYNRKIPARIGLGCTGRLNPREWKPTRWFIKINNQTLRCFCQEKDEHNNFQLRVIEPARLGIPTPPESLLSNSVLFNQCWSVLIDPSKPPRATLQFGLDSISAPIKPQATIADTFIEHADALDLDPQWARGGTNQSMFSDPRINRIIFRVNGKTLPHYTLIEEGMVYIATIHHEMKGG